MEQFTKKAASALKLAAKAARRRGHSYIGSEHLLLGLLEEGEGTAAQVLIGAGVEEEKLKSLIDHDSTWLNSTRSWLLTINDRFIGCHLGYLVFDVAGIECR